MSLCDACRNPGRCCVGFHLNSDAINRCETPLEVLIEMATIHHTDEWMSDIGLPFLPLYRRAYAENPDWLLWCPRLGPDGRCTDYENRPAVCRVFEPGRDLLCAEWDGVPR